MNYCRLFSERETLTFSNMFPAASALYNVSLVTVLCQCFVKCCSEKYDTFTLLPSGGKNDMYSYTDSFSYLAD